MPGNLLPRHTRPSTLRSGALWSGRSDVQTELGVVEPDRLARARAEGRVGVVVVVRQRVHGGARLLGRLHRDVAVAGQARAGGDELAEDDVLLQAEQRVRTTLHRGLGEHPGRLLEGGGREPGVGRERGLGDAHELGTTRSRLAALGHDATVLVLEATALGEHAGQQVGVTGLDDRDATQHLADDDLDVLVVDRHTLLDVDLLDLVHEVLLRGPGAQDAQHLLGVDRAYGQRGADLDVVAVVDEQAGPLGDGVALLLRAVVRREQDRPRLVGLLDLDPARGLGDRGDTLGGARLEELDDTRQTLGDVVTGHTTGVEGTHRQLGAGLTDGLGGDDADRLTDVDELAGRQRAAVAARARSDLGVTREHRTDLDRVDTGVEQRADDDVTEVDAGLRQHLAVLDDVLGEGPGVDRGLDDVGQRPGTGTRVDDGDRHRQAALGAAVVLTDDDVLRHVDEAPGQVAGVGRPQRGVGQTLAGTVRGDEELEHRQALAEVRADRSRDDVALGVGHQATHTGNLAQLHPVTASTRGDHLVDGVVARDVGFHLLGDLVGRLGPDLDELLTALVVGDQTPLVLGLDLGGLDLVALEDLQLARRRDDVGDGDRGAGPGGPVEAVLLERVEGRRDLDLAVALGEVVDDRREALLVDLVVDVGVVLRERLVEERAAQGGLHQPGVQETLVIDHESLCQLGTRRRHDVGQPDPHLGAQLDLAAVERHPSLGHGREDPPGTLALGHLGGEVVEADDHVLGGHGDRAAVGRLEDVVGRQHEDAGLGLRLCRERHVDGHLVTVEVGVERRADERVDLDGLALDELRLERLDAEAVQRGRTVQQHGVLGDDLFEDIPHDRALTLDHPLGGLDVLRVVEVDEALHDERLEQLQRHLLGQAALVQLELRTDDDDRTAGVVDALAEQVLAEPALLALEHVRERLERPVARPGDRTATTTVVEQRVDGLLEHPLLVVDDDLRRTEVEQPLEAVVAVDDATVEVVEGGGREAATVELHHRAQVRRNDRDRVEHHAGRLVGRRLERRHDLEPLEGTGLALTLAGGDDLAQQLGLGLEVEGLQTLLDRRGTHAALEVQTEPVTHLAVEDLIALEVLDLEVLEPVPDLGEPLDLQVGALADLVHLALGAVADLALGVGLGALGLEGRDVGLELLGAGVDVGVATVLELLLLDLDLGLERGQVGVPLVLVDARDHVCREVDDLLQVLRGQVEQVAEARRNALEVPDVGDRGSELDVAHPLTTDGRTGHRDAAALTDDALEADSLVLATGALPVPGRTEDLLAEQTVLLRLEGAVVDRLGLLDLAVAPGADVLGGGKTDTQLVKEVDVEHVVPSLVTLEIQRWCSQVGGCPGWCPYALRVPPPEGSAPGIRAHLLDLFDAARLPPGQVDAELFRCAEDVLFGFLHLDLLTLAVEHLDVEAEGLHLLDEHLEGLGDAGLGDVLALDDGLVDLHAAEHVVGLDGEELLQAVGGAVRLEGPHLHLAEALATELGLTPEGLLRDHRVRPRGAGVDLVVDQVGEFQDVHVADRDRLVVDLTGTPVVQLGLAVGLELTDAVDAVR